MEKFEQKTEQLERPEEPLQNFFESLPSHDENVYEIPRSTVDALVERGVSVEKICQEFVQRGFLLHGTGVKGITELEPRQSRCESGLPENCQRAVYASGDVRIPLFMSIVGAVSSDSKSSGYTIDVAVDDGGNSTEAIKFSCNVPIPTDIEGVVYVLPAEKFQQAGHGQSVSLETVRVAYALPIRPEDFPYPIEQVNEDEDK